MTGLLKLLQKNVLPYIGELQAAEVEPYHIREILFELITAPLSELDLEARIWSIPPARTKNKRWHLLPLTDMVIDLIDQVRALHGRKGSYLFPKYGDPDKPGPMSRHVLSRNVLKLLADTGFT